MTIARMKRPIVLLLLLAIIDRIILQGIYPVLPVMVADLGASPRANSNFMGITYIAITAGSYLTPRILRYYTSVTRLSIIISVLTALALAAMGAGMGYGGFLAATSFYWFLCGIQINIYSIIMSYVSPPEKTGVNFGLLANTALVGAVAGSFFIGSFIHHFGGFNAFLVFGAVTILSRLLMLRSGLDVVYARHSTHVDSFKVRPAVWLFLIAFNAGIMLVYVGRFNLSLIMKQQQYDIDSISYLFGLGALLVFPFPYLFGRLSQWVPGKLLLGLTLAGATVAMLLLYKGSTYSVYLLSCFLMCVMTYSSRGVSQKMIYDMYPLGEQKHAQSLLSSANWVAAILGFALISLASGNMSLEVLSLCCFGVGIAAMLLLFFVKMGK